MLSAILSNVIAQIIIWLLGIGTATTVVIKSDTNPRKKWRIMIIIFAVAWIIAGVSTSTYPNGYRQTSDFGVTLQWVFGTLFIFSGLGSWVNKR